jgi:hypothetical protein
VRAAATALLTLSLLAGCNRNEEPEEGKAVTVDVPRAATSEAGVTPMAERIAVIGLLNKRNGIVRDLTLRPGQAVRYKDAIVRLRACEASPPWEAEPLTGAFVQLDIRQTDNSWRRVFSGWLYKESPSLNVVEHQVYDVWPKSCTMTYPAGPAAPDAPVASSNRSRARNSSGGADAPPAEGPSTEPPIEPVEPSAPANIAT